MKIKLLLSMFLIMFIISVNEHERWPEIEHCKWPGNEHFGGQDAVERSMVGKRQSNFEIVIC